MEWKEVLGNNTFKEDLIKLIALHSQTESFRRKLPSPFIATDNKNTCKLSPTECELLFRCNHVETDDWLMLLVILADEHVVVISKDADVLVLIVWKYYASKI